jgi:hypothetical protein
MKAKVFIVLIVLSLIFFPGVVSWKSPFASKEEFFFDSGLKLFFSPIIGYFSAANVAIVLGVAAVLVLLIVWRRGLDGQP